MKIKIGVYHEKGAPLIRELHSEESSTQRGAPLQMVLYSKGSSYKKVAPLIRELRSTGSSTQRGAPLKGELHSKGAPLKRSSTQKEAPLLKRDPT